MSSLTREQLLGSRDRKVQKVTLPDAAMNGTDHVYVRRLSALEASRLTVIADSDTLNSIVTTCIIGICDEDGNPLFTDADHDAVADMDFGTLNRCVEALMELNELTEDGSKARKKD
jgi:hypothetical protein